VKDLAETKLTCPLKTSTLLSEMNNKHTYKELELVKLLSEAIDELNNMGCDDIANELTEKLELLLGWSVAKP
jgi:hypothetical protein